MKKLVARSALPAIGLVAVALVAAASYALIPAGVRTARLGVDHDARRDAADSPSVDSAETERHRRAEHIAEPERVAVPSASRRPPPPLKVVSVSPRAKAANVSFASTIRIRFSAALAADTPLPKLTPGCPAPGRSSTARRCCSCPRVTCPSTPRCTLTVPGGSRRRARRRRRPADAQARRCRSRSAAPRRRCAFSSFSPSSGTCRCASSSRAEQTSGSHGDRPRRTTCRPSAASRATLDLLSLKPLTGSLRLALSPHPACALGAVAARRRSTTLIRGAVMAFESDHKLAADGVVGRAVWTALLKATCRHLGQQARLRLHRGLDGDA